MWHHITTSCTIMIALWNITLCSIHTYTGFKCMCSNPGAGILRLELRKLGFLGRQLVEDVGFVMMSSVIDVPDSLCLDKSAENWKEVLMFTSQM